MLFKALTVAAAIGGAMAQRPTNTSICDYYTTALLKNNTAANQLTLLTLVVNTAVIGNYTQPNVGVVVPGILAPGEVNGTKVDLAGYFNGGFASTNRGGSSGESVNFLDDGGAAPLLKDMPANGTSSNQYTLLTHLYEYFGTLLGCSMQGMTGYDAYDGSNSMYTVHKYMALSEAEITYFITQVALSAASFGVAEDDLKVVGTALTGLFGMRCAPEMVVVPSQPAALQAICIDSTCPEVTANATCSAYAAVSEPAVANATLAGTTAASGGSASATATQTGSSTATGSAPAGSGSASATGSAAHPSGSTTSGASSVQQISWAVAVGLVGAAFFL